MAHPLRNPVHVLEPQDSAERFRRQSYFGPEDRQEPPMTESASSCDVSNRGAGAIRPEAFKGKRHHRMQTAALQESLDQSTFEELEASAMCGRRAQTLSKVTHGAVTPQGGQIHMRIGEFL